MAKLPMARWLDRWALASRGTATAPAPALSAVVGGLAVPLAAAACTCTGGGGGAARTLLFHRPYLSWRTVLPRPRRRGRRQWRRMSTALAHASALVPQMRCVLGPGSVTQQLKFASAIKVCHAKN
jgi:hypothetical protein